MGRTSTVGLVKYWLENQEKSKCLQLRKFYKAEDILLIFKLSSSINSRPNPYVNREVTRGYVTKFTSILNKIVREKLVPTFKHRYNREEGFEYILVSHSETNTNVDNIRVSARKCKSNVPDKGVSTTQPAPSQLPIVATPPTNEPTPVPSQLPTATSPSLVVPSNEPITTLTTPTTQLAPSRFPPSQLITPSIQLFPPFHLANLPTPTPTTANPPISSIESHTHEERSNSSEFNRDKENDTTTYNKMDQPVALYLFFGRERAKKIIAEETARENNGTSTFVKIKYGPIVKQHIITQIKKLQEANLYTDRWKKLLEDEDKTETCSEYEKVQIRNKAVYLSMLYHLSLKLYNTTPDFGSIVDTAMQRINSNRLIDYLPEYHQCRNGHIIQSHRTLYDWFRLYRDNDCFPNPNNTETTRLPPILNACPDLVDDILTHCRSNIDTLSSESVHHFILTEALPKLAETMKKEQNQDETYTITELLQCFGLRKLHLITVQRWMRKLGFKYEPVRKSYYVDNHESEENVRYRNEFIERYFEYELLTHRWYSISDDNRKKMVEEGEISESIGYEYERDGQKYWEFHVDDHRSFQTACDHLLYGGFLSVRKPVDKKKQ